MKKVISILFGITLLAILFLTRCADETVQPVKGFFILNDLLSGKASNLSGEWEFYREKFYLGNDFNTTEAAHKKRYINYSTNWNKEVIDGSGLPKYGYATYRLKIYIPAEMKDYIFLRIPYYYMSVNIYSNNHLIFSNGKVGSSADTSETLQYFPYITQVLPENGVIELVIHASNYQFPSGGIRGSIIIGSKDSVIGLNEVSISIDMLLIGCLLIMSIYNLILFTYSRKNYLTIYFSLICMASAFHMIVNGASLPGKFGLMWETILRIHYISWISVVYFFYKYFADLFENYINKLLYFIYTFGSICICLLIAVSPVRIFNYVFYPIFILHFFIILYALIVSIIEFKKKREDGAIFMFSFAVIFIFMLVDNIPFLRLNQLNTAEPIGIVIFSILQSMLIRKEINKQLTANSMLTIEVQHRNDELAALNANLEIIVAKKTEELVVQNSIIKANNLNLEKKIENAIGDLHLKDDMIMINSRLASMGEMIGFIGHQWKQDIYAISLYTEALKNILQKKGILDIDTAKEPLEKIDSFIIEMYNNLNDFADFVKPTKEVEYFSIIDSVEETLQLMHDFITINSVEIVRDYKSETHLVGFSNELKQVVMNIIKNAIDAFSERKSKNRIIIISVYGDEVVSYLSIGDNAGGIPLDHPDEVFDKFYTSKAEGTGLGLYLSKIIVEQRFNGRIEVCNTGGGASFAISIPVLAEDIVF